MIVIMPGHHGHILLLQLVCHASRVTHSAIRIYQNAVSLSRTTHYALRNQNLSVWVWGQFLSIFGCRTPAELHIPTETQVRVISTLTYVGIRLFCATGCSIISFFLINDPGGCHLNHAPTILTTAHLSPGPPGILSRK